MNGLNWLKQHRSSSDHGWQPTATLTNLTYKENITMKNLHTTITLLELKIDMTLEKLHSYDTPESLLGHYEICLERDREEVKRLTLLLKEEIEDLDEIWS